MINKAQINKMLEMPDDKLVAMLKFVMSASGIDMGDKRFDESTVKKLRAVLREVTDDDIARAMFLIDRFKRGG